MNRPTLSALLLSALLSVCAVWPSAARAEDDPAAFVALMDQYLSLAEKVVATADRREAAVFMALEGIFEVYEQRRDAQGAIRHLTGILERHPNDRVVRNLVRFKLRDIYKEIGELDKALEQLDLVVAENTGG
ncbi:MAG: hypothetical protein AAGA23_20795 [Pseudomonadota bacterium]